MTRRRRTSGPEPIIIELCKSTTLLEDELPLQQSKDEHSHLFLLIDAQAGVSIACCSVQILVLQKNLKEIFGK